MADSQNNLIGLGMPAAHAKALGYITFAGAPSGNVTPNHVGQLLWDSSNENFYLATGVTDTDWKSLTS